MAAEQEPAARFVEKRRDDYISEHGSYDHETGVTEFPGDGAEYVEELTEIAEGIRALVAPPPPQAPLTDEQIEEAQAAAYRELRAKGYNGGMGGKQWDLASARAIERAVLEARRFVVRRPDGD